MTPKRNLEKVVAKVGDLPAIPAVVANVMEMTADPNVSVSSVSELIEQDPALTAKLLKVSNSAYYGMRQVVGTLKLALVILGVREVRNLVLGISVLDTLRDKDTEFLLSNRGLWNHSVKVAGMTKKLGAELELRLQGEDFMSGLLHDIGKMILWKELGDEYRKMYERTREEGLVLVEQEQAMYGFDHADAGAALAHLWNLPESLTCALEYHHEREERILAAAPAPALPALVRISNAAVHDDWTADDLTGITCCDEEEAWDILEQTTDKVFSRDARIDLMGNIVKYLANAPTLAI